MVLKWGGSIICRWKGVQGAQGKEDQCRSASPPGTSSVGSEVSTLTRTFCPLLEQHLQRDLFCGDLLCLLVVKNMGMEWEHLLVNHMPSVQL